MARTKEATARWAAISYNALLSTELAVAADRSLRWIFDGAATAYDRAADAASYETIRLALREAAEHGVVLAEQPAGWHRLFGGHDLSGMWGAACGALPNDTFVSEAQGCLTALWKDLVTPNGLPVATIAPATFEVLTSTMSEYLGVSQKWVGDALTYTATEGFGAVIGSLAVVLGWNRADAEQFSILAGSLGVATLASANPLLAVVAIVSLARAFQHARRRDSLPAVMKGLGKGGAGTLAFVAASGLMPGPMWIALVSGVVLAMLARQAVEKVSCAETATIAFRLVARPTLDLYESRLPWHKAERRSY